MRKVIALVGLLVFTGVTYGVVTMLKDYSTAPASGDAVPKKVIGGVKSGDTQAGEVLRATKEKYVPPVSTTGPWPKAVVDQTEYEFGRMEVGQEDSHEFIIRNEGDAPLEIAKGNTTCQCTISEVENSLIAPGQSATVTLRWKPTVQSEAFEKGAEIRTNDPNNLVINFKIVGKVVPRFVLLPSESWEIREVQEGSTSVAEGFLLSPVLDDLQVEKMVYDEERMEVTVRPVDLNQVREMKGKSGLGFRVLVKTGMPVGAFTFPLKIYTNAQDRGNDGELGDQAVVDVKIVGRREGPIKLLGTSFIPAGSIVALGSFAAQEGRSVSITLLVRNGPEEGLQLVSVESDPAFLRVELAPEEKMVGKSKRYTMKVTFPAGSPRMSRIEDNLGSIRIKTNHADAAEINLQVQCTAF